MTTSLESGSLYMMLAAVPLLPTIDYGMTQPGVFTTTAWCLSVAFGGWVAIGRWKCRSKTQQPAAL